MQVLGESIVLGESVVLFAFLAVLLFSLFSSRLGHAMPRPKALNFLGDQKFLFMFLF